MQESDNSRFSNLSYKSQPLEEENHKSLHYAPQDKPALEVFSERN